MSPFSSLVLLVNKKMIAHGGYVECQALNQLALEDKFPIPVIDELLDELIGMQVFF